MRALVKTKIVPQKVGRVTPCAPLAGTYPALSPVNNCQETAAGKHQKLLQGRRHRRPSAKAGQPTATHCSGNTIANRINALAIKPSRTTISESPRPGVSGIRCGPAFKHKLVPEGRARHSVRAACWHVPSLVAGQPSSGKRCGRVLKQELLRVGRANGRLSRPPLPDTQPNRSTNHRSQTQH